MEAPVPLFVLWKTERLTFFSGELIAFVSNAHILLALINAVTLSIRIHGTYISMVCCGICEEKSQVGLCYFQLANVNSTPRQFD